MENLSVAESVFGIIAAALTAVAAIYSLKLFRRQMPRGVERPEADVRVTLEDDCNCQWFIVANQGTGDAREVRFEISADRSSPLIQDDYDEKVPVPVLRPGNHVRVMAAITKDTGTVFHAHWRWLEADGSPKDRSGRISI